jgi:glycosyltransferase involved in cell wall biosynthesis
VSEAPRQSTSPRRIVYVWDADYPWDIRTEKTCLALTQAGHDVHIVARNKKWSVPVERLPEATVHRMVPWRWAGRRLDALLGFPAFFNPRWRRLLARVVREVRADVIIARDIPLCPTAITVGRKAGIPVVLDMAENYPAMMRAIWETGRHRPVDSLVRNPRMVAKVEQWCVDRVDHIVVVVEESAARVQQLGVPAKKITVVSNTPFVSHVRPMDDHRPTSSANAGTALDVVYIGIVEVTRGLLESVTAISYLRADGHRVRLRIIGAGRDDALIRQHAATLGLGPDAVEFLGYVPNRQALDIVAAADVGLLPHHKCESWDTTIPNKLFDYMAAGLPVVSSNADPCARILAQTGAGIVFQSQDARDLASGLQKMLSPAARRSFGTAGQRAIREQYNWEHDASVFLNVVNTVRTNVS